MKNRKQVIVIVWMLSMMNGLSFAESKTIEIDRLNYMIGEWRMIAFEPTSDGRMKEGRTVPMTGSAILDNQMIELNTTMDFGDTEKPWIVPAKMIFSYDAFNKIYRLIIMDGGYGFTSFNSGNFNEDKLVLTDSKAETTLQSETGKVIGRITLIKKDNNNFEFNMEVSSDSGKSFGPYGWYRFHRGQ